MKEENKKVVKHFYEPKSSPLVDVCEWQEDEEGHHLFVKVGEKNLDDEIQLYKDSCDIKVLIERMMNGDVATIRSLASPGLYGDVNDFPEEMHPAAYADGLKNLYENQPESVKKMYPTYEAFAKYFTNLTEEMVKAMAEKEAAAAAPKTEVNANE